MESILTSIKKMLGIESGYTHFDNDIILLINGVFTTLNQIGVGPEQPVVITGDLETWSGCFPNVASMESVKTYVYLKVRMIFDTSTVTSYVLDALNRQAQELEWRLSVQAET